MEIVFRQALPLPGVGGPSAPMTSTAIVAYLALFATVGFVFVLASLLLGKLVRSSTPTPDKREIYECGEPAIGSGYVQFDLRFYVVALVFLIFEVEVAMFFPTAVVFGKARQLRDPSTPAVVVFQSEAPAGNAANHYILKMTPEAENAYRELGIAEPASQLRGETNEHGIAATEEAVKNNADMIEKQADTLALTSMLDLAVFFAVLLVGFAFVWWRGDLNWVRATRHPAAPAETAAMAMKLRSNR